MMKITATAATPYSAVELLPEDVVVVVTVEVAPDIVIVVAVPVMVVVITAPLAPVTVVVVTCPGSVVVLTEVVVVVLVLVTVAVLVVGGGGTFCRVKATTSPGVVPGHVDTASGLQEPTGVRMYSCPLTDAPMDKPCAIGAPT